MDDLSLYDFNIEEVRHISDVNSLTYPILAERAAVKNKILEAASRGEYQCKVEMIYAINKNYFSRLKFNLTEHWISGDKKEINNYTISW